MNNALAYRHKLVDCGAARYRADGSVGASYRSIEHVLQSKDCITNRHLRRLTHTSNNETTWTEAFLQLVVCDSRFANIACQTSKALKKELVEGMSMVERVEFLMEQLDLLTNNTPNENHDGQGILLLDLCSGKGIAALLLALRFPQATVVGVDIRPPNPHEHHLLQNQEDDNNTNTPVPHNFIRVTANLYDTTRMNDILQQYTSGTTAAATCIVVGTHLCGDLCRVALDFVKDHYPERIAAAALVPCCLPRQKAPAGCTTFSGKDFGYDTTAEARRLGVPPFGLWLERLARRAPLPNRIWRDDDMLTTVNAYVLVGVGETNSNHCPRRRRRRRTTRTAAYHRLRSIQYDVEHHVVPAVQLIQQHFVSQQPQYHTSLFLNARCGTWYWPTSGDNDATFSLLSPPARQCHFKSTDGHVGSWLFSLKRLNTTVLQQGTQKRQPTIIVLLDASANKVMPDSFSRTIPLWAAVWNQILWSDKDQGDSTLLSSEYAQLKTLSSVVSETEHETMQQLVPERVMELQRSQLLETALPSLTLDKPLTPFWIQDLTSPDDLVTQLPTAHDLQHCHPIICLNCSVPALKGWITQDNPHNTFYYTPGAADDEESWARGLTPNLFWNHFVSRFQTVLSSSEAADSAREIEDTTDALIDDLVQQYKEEQNGGGSEESSAGTASGPNHHYFDTLGDTGLSIGSRRAGRPPDCWVHFDAILNVSNSAYDDMLETMPNTHQHFYLQLPVQEGKRGALEHWLAAGILYCIVHLQQGRRVLVHCAQGKDRSVAVVMAVLMVVLCVRDNNDNALRFPLSFHRNNSLQCFPLQQLWNKLDGSTSPSSDLPGEENETTKQYQSSGLSETVVQQLLGRPGRDVLLAVVQQWRQATTSPDNQEDGNANSNDSASVASINAEPAWQPLANKQMLRMALHLIKQDRIVAEPSRSTMQKLNRFFMSQEYEATTHEVTPELAQQESPLTAVLQKERNNKRTHGNQHISLSLTWGLLLCFACNIVTASPSDSIYSIVNSLRHRQSAMDTKDLPFISLCFAQSLDGKLAMYSDPSEGCGGTTTTCNLSISGDTSLLLTHALRSCHDGILVGGRTFSIDNPRLSNRLWPHNAKQPRAVVLDSLLDNFNSLGGSRKARNLVVCCSDTLPLPRVTEHDVEFLPCKTTHNGSIDIVDALMKLKTLYGIQSIMLEGGPKVLGHFFDAGIFDCVCITIAPKIFGSGLGISLKTVCALDGDMNLFQLGKDICMVAFPNT